MAKSDDNSQKFLEDENFKKFREDAAAGMRSRLLFTYMNDKMKNEKDFMSDILPCSVGLLALSLNPSDCENVKKNLLDPLKARWRMEHMGKLEEHYAIHIGGEIYCLGNAEYYADFNTIDKIYSFKLWWIILLRFYIQQTKDDTVWELVQGEFLAIMECLLGNSDTHPQLWNIKCPHMLKPETFMSSNSIEGQATMYFILKCADELMNLPRFGAGQRSMEQKLTSMKERINEQIIRMDFLIPKHYWVDNSKVANCQTAPLQGGFYQYGFQVESTGLEKSTKWSLKGNCIAILSSLATPQEAEAIMNFIEKYWAQVIENVPQPNEYSVDKDDFENFHGLLWLLVAASIKARKVEIAKRAVEVFEMQRPLSTIDLKDYKSEANWTCCGYLVSKILIENDSVISKFSFEKVSASNTQYLSTFLEQREKIITRFELITKHFTELWREIEGDYTEWLIYCRNPQLQKICQRLGTNHGIDPHTAPNFFSHLCGLYVKIFWHEKQITELELTHFFLQKISEISIDSKDPLPRLLHKRFERHRSSVKNNLVMVQNLALNSKTEPVNLREYLRERRHFYIPIPRSERFWTDVDKYERSGTCLDCNKNPATIELPCGDKYSCKECFSKFSDGFYIDASRRLWVPYFCVICDKCIDSSSSSIRFTDLPAFLS